MQTSKNRQIVSDYIETVWNKLELTSIKKFLSDDYQDYSLIPGVPPDRNGLLLWIQNTSEAFDHSTIIESAVAEDDYVAVRISFKITHKGTWRNIPSTGREAIVKGIPFF